MQVQSPEEDSLRRSCAKLNALHRSVGLYIDADEVAEYHGALDDASRAGRNIEEFRIPSSAFKRQIVSISMRRGYGPQFSKDHLVARDYFMRKIEAVIEYLSCGTSV
jgi:hypothetical protein